MSGSREGYTATLLPNGKVLVAGGSVGVTTTAGAELYDPSTGAFAATGSMGTARAFHTATLLSNGKVLITGGGTGGFNLAAVATTELYDPVAKTFSPSGTMSAARFSHTATLLPSGNVLVAGGTTGGGGGPQGFVSLATAEIYNPVARTFSATGSMAAARFFHTATLLNNGQVLITGGSSNGSTAIGTSEIYDATLNGGSGAFIDTGSISSARYRHTATLLTSGKVLIAGGHGASGYLATAELYDPAFGTFSLTGSMNAARSQHTATLLPNGKVLIAGGQGSMGITASAEIYDSGAGKFSVTGSMSAARLDHTATLLPNGKVLVAGGYGSTSSQIATAELYTMSNFPDLVLQNTGARQVAFWYTSGSNVAAGVYAMIGGAPITLPPSWQIVAAGDFNGDGVQDLVLDNTSTGQIAFWFTSANIITSGAYATSGGGQITLPPGWQIVGAADFDHDGKTDLVLQNTTSGLLALWMMNGTDVTTGVYITSGANPIALPAGWQVVGVGDFSGDGYPDLILVNSSTGQIAFWIINNANVTSGVYATDMNSSPVSVPSGWQIAAVGDYSQNGSETLVLQNLSSGLLAFWYFNYTTLNDSSYVFTDGRYTTLPGGWQVNGPR